MLFRPADIKITLNVVSVYRILAHKITLCLNQVCRKPARTHRIIIAKRRHDSGNGHSMLCRDTNKFSPVLLRASQRFFKIIAVHDVAQCVLGICGNGLV